VALSRGLLSPRCVGVFPRLKKLSYGCLLPLHDDALWYACKLVFDDFFYHDIVAFVCFFFPFYVFFLLTYELMVLWCDGMTV
jgi:hypothetical protein